VVGTGQNLVVALLVFPGAYLNQNSKFFVGKKRTNKLDCAYRKLQFG